MYLGRRVDNWVIEDVEIGLPPPGDKTLHIHTHYSTIQHRESLTEMAQTGAAYTISVLQNT
jgi:hypothetical protein